jgi:predicted porin
MRKSLFAMAALGVVAGGASSVALAQSSVTLYGVIDTAIEYVNRVPAASSIGPRFGMANLGGLSPSRWGLRGVEDLGGGNQAFFWLESGFAPDSGLGVGSLFGRQAAVGLRNEKYGQLSFGRQLTSIFESTANFMPMRFATTYEPVGTAVGLAYRENNMVKYGGNFGPLHAAAHYSFGTGLPLQGAVPSTIADGEVPGNQRAQTGYGASAYYYDQGIGVGVGYDRVNPAASATGPVGKIQLANIAGSYAYGPVRLFAGYRYRNSEFGNGVTELRDNFYWTGITYQATPALGLSAAYYYDQVKRAALLPTSSPTSLPNFSQVTLQADYALSKRTDIYITSAWSHNGALNYDSLLQTGGLYGYGTSTTLTGLPAGQKNMVGVAIGLRHIF